MESVCFTGACPDMTRAELTEMAEEKFEVKTSVTKDLDILVCADPSAGSSKLEKAKKNGTRIISYEDFLEMLESDDDEDEDGEDGMYSEEQAMEIIWRINDTMEKEAIRIKTHEAESPLSLTASKFGGLPYWTADEEYPKDDDGNELTLLAQINFSDVPHLPDYPEKGLLQFFILADSSVWLDMEGTTQNYWRVVWREDVDESLALSADALHEMGVQSAAEVVDDGRDFPFSEEFSLSFEKSLSHPNYMLWDYDEMVKRAAKELGYPVHEDASEAFPEDFRDDHMFDMFDAEQHQIGGYPNFSVYDIRNEDEVLLLQIVSDEDIAWGDSGIANFFIKPEDLKKRDFSNILCTCSY